MGAKKGIRNRVRRTKREEMELDITSLLDILTIILFFLILNYNSSDVVINVLKEITPAKSYDRTDKSLAPLVQVGQEKIYFNDVEVYNVNNSLPSQMDHKGRRIVPLFNHLDQYKVEADSRMKGAAGKESVGVKVNLVVDKNVDYAFLKKVLYTCQNAGFHQYQFVVYPDAASLETNKGS